MTETMVDRMARAMLAATYGETHSCGWDVGEGERNASPEFKERLRRMARAALAAMREPTEEMKGALAKAIDDGGLSTRAMIWTVVDAALEEPSDERACVG